MNIFRLLPFKILLAICESKRHKKCDVSARSIEALFCRSVLRTIQYKTFPKAKAYHSILMLAGLHYLLIFDILIQPT